MVDNCYRLLCDDKTTIVELAAAIEACNRAMESHSRFGVSRISVEVYAGRAQLTLRAPVLQAVPSIKLMQMAAVVYIGGKLVKHRYETDYKRVNAENGVL